MLSSSVQKCQKCQRMAPLARRGPGIRSLTSSSARAVPSRRSGLVMKDRSSNLVASSGKQVVVGGEVVYTTMDDEDVLASSGGDAIGGGGVFASDARKSLEKVDPTLRTDLMSSATVMSQVMDQNAWERHRSSLRFFRVFFNVFSSTVFKRIFVPSLLPVAIAVATCLLGWPVKPINALPFSIGGGLVSFMLVFRTNSGYGRFVEGRILWGTMLNTLRDVGRVAATYSTPSTRMLAMRVICLAECFAWLLKTHLRQGRTVGFGKHSLPEDKDTATPRVIEAMKPMGEAGAQDIKRLTEDCPHGPLICMILLTDACKKLIEEAKLPFDAATELQKYIQILGGCLGGSERILKTPIPQSYTRHTGRVLMMFLCSLPLTLTPVMGWSVVPAVFILSYALMGVDEIGIELEEPFATLPLAPISTTVRNNLKSTRELMMEGI
ncbi:ion channel-forming bestrophin [Pycnococcus provasolii]